MFQSFPFLSQQLWHLQLQLCHNHTSLLVNKYYDWSVISLSVCVLLSQSSLPSLLSITFFPVCGHSTFPSFPIYVFLGCPSEFVQPRAYDGNPSAPSYCICLFFFSAHFAEWRQILFFNECQWVQFTFILPVQLQVIHEQQIIGWFPLFAQHTSCSVFC